MNKQLKTLISWAKKYMVTDDDLKVSIEGKEYKISCVEENGSQFVKVFVGDKFTEHEHLGIEISYREIALYEYNFGTRKWKEVE